MNKVASCSLVNTLAAKARARVKAAPRPGDYKDPHTGLLICGFCRTPRECVIKRPNGCSLTVSCMCACDVRAYEMDKAKDKAARVENLRARYIKDPALINARFENSEDSDCLQKARRYVENWESVAAHNAGLLLYGPSRSGKTHLAACIANALIDKGIPAGITSIPELLRLPLNERDETIGRYIRLPLLVIDDLGAERGTSYGLETVYSVIDGRLKSEKPMVVTTNLAPEDICKPPAKDNVDYINYDRIHQRILESCTPVLIKGHNYRQDIAAAKEKFLSEIFEGGKKHE